MANSLGTLTLDLVAKIGGFTGPIDKASRQSKQFAKDVDKMGKTIGIGLGVAAGAATAALTAIVNQQMGLIDNSAKLAIQLDTTYASIANIERAGELGGIGMDKIVASSKQLSINIGKAIQGTDAQVGAFDRLGLRAQEIYDLPLDQRIATINKALLDNVAASERAAVAADLYGAKNAKAIQLLDPETIAEAARQTEIFGLNLSDIDAAKVEMAGDAMSTFGLLVDGVGKQLTVELAPILQAIGDEFLNAADEAGGLGTVVRDTTRDVVRAMAFVADAGDGVGRVFSTVANTLVGMYATAVGDVNSLSAAVARGLSSLPDFAGGAGFAEQAKEYSRAAAESYSIAEQALQQLRENLETPLAGQAILDAYDSVQAAAEEAAAAAIVGRKEVAASGAAFVETEDKKTKAAKKTIDSVQTQITALERAAKVWGMSADEVAIYTLEADGATAAQLSYAKSLLDTVAGYESAKKAADDYAGLVSDLRTEEEKRSDTLREQLKILDAMQGISGIERSRVAGRAADQATEDAPGFGGVDASIGGAFGELQKIDEAEEKLAEWYKTQLTMLESFRAERADLSSVWDAQEIALKQEHEDELARIERARQQTQLAAAESIFGDIADITKEFAGEQSTAYKIAFAAQKAAAIAQSLVAIQTGIALAAANPFPLNLAAMASVAAATAGLVSNISSIGIDGQAHDGIMSVPSSGTWNLEKGERVTTANTSAALDKTLADIQAGQRGGGGGGSAPNITINMPPMKDQRENREATAHTARRIGQVMRSTGRYS